LTEAGDINEGVFIIGFWFFITIAIWLFHVGLRAFATIAGFAGDGFRNGNSSFGSFLDPGAQHFPPQWGAQMSWHVREQLYGLLQHSRGQYELHDQKQLQGH